MLGPGGGLPDHESSEFRFCEPPMRETLKLHAPETKPVPPKRSADPTNWICQSLWRYPDAFPDRDSYARDGLFARALDHGARCPRKLMTNAF